MRKIYLLILVLFLLSACSSGITQEEAEQTALTYADTYGRYGVGDEEVISKNIDIVSSKRVEDNWYITLKITSLVNGTEKSGDLTLIIDDNKNIKGVASPNQMKTAALPS